MGGGLLKGGLPNRGLRALRYSGSALATVLLMTVYGTQDVAAYLYCISSIGAPLTSMNATTNPELGLLGSMSIF